MAAVPFFSPEFFAVARKILSAYIYVTGSEVLYSCKRLRFSSGVKMPFYDVSSDDKPIFFHYFPAKTHFLHDEGHSFFEAIFLRKWQGSRFSVVDFSTLPEEF